jgi:hypothetical protein
VAMRELMHKHLANSRNLLCSRAQGLAAVDRHVGRGTWVVAGVPI